jgi:hypothetical protein
VSALVLDAGAFVAADGGDRSMIARLRAAQQHGLDLRTNAMVVAQIWRDEHGRQAQLARVLRAVDVRPVADHDGRAAGVLLHKSGSSDPIDASVVLLAEPGDRIVTSDPNELRSLADAANSRALIVPC